MTLDIIDAEPAESLWDRRDIAIVLLLVGLMAALYLRRIGDYGLWDFWEPKYAQAVREMTARGDYITPYFDGEIRWTKPILIYWLILVPVSFLGNNELAARLPSACAAIACVVVIYMMVRRLVNRRTAIMTACVLATLPQFCFLARQAVPDMVLTACLGATMAFAALGRFSQTRNRLWFVLAYTALALAFLAKGPVAGAITVGAMMLFLMLDFPWSRLSTPRSALTELLSIVRQYHMVVGAVVFTLVAAPWYVAMLIEHQQEYIDQFLGYENVQRFTGNVRGHRGLADFYVRTMFHGFFPWGSMLPVALIMYFRNHEKRDETFLLRWYFLSWFLAIFLIFTMSGTKIQHYIAPILPSTAIIIGMLWGRVMQRDTPHWCMAAFLPAIPLAYIPVRDFIKESDKYVLFNFTNSYSLYDLDVSPFLQYILLVWVLAMAVAAVMKRFRTAAVIAVGAAACYGGYFSQVVIPHQSPYRSLKSYVDTHRDHAVAGDKIIHVGSYRRYSMNYYLDNNYIHIDDDDLNDVMVMVDEHSRVSIVVDERRLRSLKDLLEHHTRQEWFTIATRHNRTDMITNIQKEVPLF